MVCRGSSGAFASHATVPFVVEASNAACAIAAKPGDQIVPAFADQAREEVGAPAATADASDRNEPAMTIPPLFRQSANACVLHIGDERRSIDQISSRDGRQYQLLTRS